MGLRDEVVRMLDEAMETNPLVVAVKLGEGGELVPGLLGTCRARAGTIASASLAPALVGAHWSSRGSSCNLHDRAVAIPATLPFPSVELRSLVGRHDLEHFDNPSRELVYPYLRAEDYEHVLDLGCGCGRVARQLIQQKPRPVSYLASDPLFSLISR